MKKSLLFCLGFVVFCGCEKTKEYTAAGDCDIQQAYAENADKVTISNGIWGTISSMEGNCMPMVEPLSNGCKHCPVQRTVKIYQYTRFDNAVPSGNSNIFFSSFNTELVAQADTDANGFYQVSIPAGHYTIAIVENGELYANGGDGAGGINPITFSTGLQNVNLAMTYKASF